MNPRGARFDNLYFGRTRRKIKEIKMNNVTNERILNPTVALKLYKAIFDAFSATRAPFKFRCAAYIWTKVHVVNQVV